MKLPNGFGSVYKLSGRRRRPWVARKTVGWNEKGQPKYKYIGYYETKKEALQALSAVNEEEERETATLQEVHERWWAVDGVKMKDSSAKLYLTSYRQAESLYNKDISKITIKQLETLLRGLPSLSAVKRMKYYICNVWEYAFYKGYISADQNERVKRLDVNIIKANKRPHERFSEEDIALINDIGAPWLIVMIYCGCRIGEFLKLKPEDIHLSEQYFSVVDSKTPSGIREVPIPDRIVDLWKDGKPEEFTVPYRTFLDHWEVEMERLGLAGHTPHDARHTCVSLLEEALIDDRVVKSIVGHKRKDITGIYSHINISVKLDAINQIC